MAVLNAQAIFLIVLSALGYSIATIGLKMGSSTISLAAIGLVALGFGAAALCEIEILRHVDLGVVYISIIGLETLIVLSYAWFIGEALSVRQIGGATMVLAGLAVVSH
ncbi:conserved membrane hypothetical protein [Roseovarius sp. EC-HK134]|jgi:multidrug transporter EmrE-like cation transporter|uniref:5-aminolevulinate synthase n=1 Tax=Roseovarius mucosus TaxID=215743 RepID=A0A1V0RLE2_9RHOB|nr:MULTISPECIES: hypothetical protein [Roseovarius]ARE82603.1 hypothetical protein ROSMUCSMR3_01108 [Roseovarius mucosus]AWZ18764.1 Hypothetical protein RAK1035_0053 [Roseovarius sp. AK1035]EDM32413.1 hypothetical protein RTM1035_13193 [Roseovarius sp. TM1035]MBW4973681.1 5-aminolevulinate synthase [Roseovarius mucosus]VVT21995.1 conserved membrane hypothetical protein [Roseovarius sp. EC-SD190]|tara:strand:+ start:812 stop:1135 length:324 start_codon:yes stop_codon:yes gene_type:complete